MKVVAFNGSPSYFYSTQNNKFLSHNFAGVATPRYPEAPNLDSKGKSTPHCLVQCFSQRKSVKHT